MTLNIHISVKECRNLKCRIMECSKIRSCRAIMPINYDIINGVIPSQKCHMRVGQIRNWYAATDVRNSV